MRACPRRHRHSVFIVTPLADIPWCKDCGALYGPDGWEYPEITRLVRGRKAYNQREDGVYKAHGQKIGGDPNDCDTPSPDSSAGDSSLANAGTRTGSD